MIVRSTGALFPNLHLITFGSSCHYLLTGKKETILFDPGLTAHASQLEARLQQINIDPNSVSKILITHLDAHRVGGITAARGILKNAKLAATPAIAKKLTDQDFLVQLQNEDRKLSKQFFSSGAIGEFKNYEFFHAMQPDLEIPAVEDIVIDGDTNIQIIKTPGHTESSVSFFITGINALICDDVVGYFRGRELPAPACDFSIDAAKQSLETLSELESAAICLPHFGALTGDLAKKYLGMSKQAITDITEECEKAWELGVSKEDIKSAIRESFYGIDKWDPIAEDCLSRSLEKLWEQIS